MPQRGRAGPGGRRRSCDAILRGNQVRLRRRRRRRRPKVPKNTAAPHGAIEHQLFSHISTNWRGRPLVSHQVIVELTGATPTGAGLRVRAELDRGSYPLGVEVSDRALAAVPLRRHDWHGEWNYTVLPTAA
jgi:hypothetical protein